MARYELTVVVDIADDFGKYQDIENKVKAARDEAGKTLLEQIMKDYEEQHFQQEPLKKKDRRIKTYHTLLGEIVLERWRGTESKKARYPVDDWMGLSGHQKVSPGLAMELVYHAVQKPYAKATVDTARITGVKRSVYGNWKLVKWIAQEQRKQRVSPVDWRKNEIPKLKRGVKDLCPILGMDPDGTYIRSRRKEKKSHEIKMAVIYAGKSPVNKAKGKLRWELMQKQVVIGEIGGGPNALFNYVTEKAIKEYGAHAETKIVSHGDGDPWLKRLKHHYWPQALLRLDPYHVFKKIREATDIEEIPKDWVDDFYRNPDSLIKKVKGFKRQLVDQEDRARVKELVTYLQNNREGMVPSGLSREQKGKYPRMYLRGSGSIESNIDWTIGARFKRPRMLWSEAGANNLLFLRAKFLNGSTGFRKVSVPADNYCSDSVKEIREFLQEW